MVHRRQAGRGATARRGDAVPARRPARGVRDSPGGHRARAVGVGAAQSSRPRGAPGARVHARSARRRDLVAGCAGRRGRARGGDPDRTRGRPVRVRAVRAVTRGRRRRVHLLRGGRAPRRGRGDRRDRGRDRRDGDDAAEPGRTAAPRGPSLSRQRPRHDGTHSKLHRRGRSPTRSRPNCSRGKCGADSNVAPSSASWRMRSRVASACRDVDAATEEVGIRQLLWAVHAVAEDQGALRARGDREDRAPGRVPGRVHAVETGGDPASSSHGSNCASTGAMRSLRRHRVPQHAVEAVVEVGREEVLGVVALAPHHRVREVRPAVDAQPADVVEVEV